MRNNNFQNKNLRLNDFTSFTGFVRWTKEREDFIRGMVGDKGYQCGGMVFSERCVQRNFDICRKEDHRVWNEPKEERYLFNREKPILRKLSDSPVWNGFNEESNLYNGEKSFLYNFFISWTNEWGSDYF